MLWSKFQTSYILYVRTSIDNFAMKVVNIKAQSLEGGLRNMITQHEHKIYWNLDEDIFQYVVLL